MAQALFANQRESNLQSTIALVEEVLVELGYPAARASASPALPGGAAPPNGGAESIDANTAHAWQITKGSATSRITLVDRAEFTHIRVCSTVMTLDAKVDRISLFAHLLELNAGLAGAAFATEDDRVLLLSERSTLDLDRSEVHDLIKRVMTSADDHDDVLVARFGGSLGG